MDTSKLRLVIVGPDPAGIGGAESFTREFMGLTDNVFFVSPYRRKLRLYDVRNSFYAFPYNLFFRVINKITCRKFLNFRLNRILKRIGPDVVLLNSPIFLDALYGVNVSRVIIRQHTTFRKMLSIPDQFFGNARLINKAVVECEIVALSEAEAEAIKAHPQFEMANVSWIRNHVNILPNKTTKENNRTLLMLGRLQNSIKRFDLIIQSMSSLPDYNLVICGSGPDRKYIQNLARPYSNITVLPATSDVVSILDSCSIYIVASEFEGYPIAAMEAQCRGLPVVVRDSFLSCTDLIGNPPAGTRVSHEFCSRQFCDQVIEIDKNYSDYSARALKNSAKYERGQIMRKWKCLIFAEEKLDNPQ